MELSFLQLKISRTFLLFSGLNCKKLIAFAMVRIRKLWIRSHFVLFTENFVCTKISLYRGEVTQFAALDLFVSPTRPSQL